MTLDGRRPSSAPRSSSPRRIRRSRSSARSTAPSSRRLRRRHRALALALRHGQGQRRPRRSCPTSSPARATNRTSGTRGSIELCHSIDYVERAFHDAREGRAAAQPVLRQRASRRRSTGRCAPTARTSCRCSRSGCRTRGATSPHPAELDAYADRVIAGYDELAPGFTQLGHPPPGDRALRDGARVRADRRQHLPRRAHARAAVPHAAGARLRRLHDARSTGCTSARRRRTAAAA